MCDNRFDILSICFLFCLSFLSLVHCLSYSLCPFHICGCCVQLYVQQNVRYNFESNSFEYLIHWDAKYNRTHSKSNKNSSATDNCVHILTLKGIINGSVAEKKVMNKIKHNKKKNQYKEYFCFVSVESKNNQIYFWLSETWNTLFESRKKEEEPNPPWKFLH